MPKSDEEEDWREIGSIDPVRGYSARDLPWRAAQRSFPCKAAVVVGSRLGGRLALLAAQPELDRPRVGDRESGLDALEDHFPSVAHVVRLPQLPDPAVCSAQCLPCPPEGLALQVGNKAVAHGCLKADLALWVIPRGGGSCRSAVHKRRVPGADGATVGEAQKVAVAEVPDGNAVTRPPLIARWVAIGRETPLELMCVGAELATLRATPQIGRCRTGRSGSRRSPLQQQPGRRSRSRRPGTRQSHRAPATELA